MNNLKKEILIGFILGIITSIVGIISCTFILSYTKEASFINTFNMFIDGPNFWMLLALGSIPMLGTFFLVLRKDQEYRARGVVFATLLVAFIAFGFYLL